MVQENAITSWNQTPLSSRLGIEYPIIQGPLGGLATQQLAAVVSNFGGLGSFGAHSLAPGAIRDVVDEIRSLTSKPFAMNLWVSMEDEGAFTSGADAFARALASISGLVEMLGSPLPAYTPYAPIRFEDQARVLLDANVPVFSFICGIPPKEILDECRMRGIVTVGTATTAAEAIALRDAGVDVIVASGFEAGGHRGSFLRTAEESLTGTFSLVPQVADLVDVPVVAAGGVSDARGVVAALALGADGVQMGTAFLACEESGASEMHRAAVLGGKAGDTALTKGFTGRLARGIRNRALEELNRPGVELLPYPLQRSLMKSLLSTAVNGENPELAQMWAGQSASLTRHTDAATLLRSLVDDVGPIADAIGRWTATRQ